MQRHVHSFQDQRGRSVAGKAATGVHLKRVDRSWNSGIKTKDFWRMSRKPKKLRKRISISFSLSSFDSRGWMEIIQLWKLLLWMLLKKLSFALISEELLEPQRSGKPRNLHQLCGKCSVPRERNRFQSFRRIILNFSGSRDEEFSNNFNVLDVQL